MSDALLISYISLWILVLALAVAVLALYHHFGQMYLNSREGREGQGPEPGKPFPTVTATSLQGTPVDLPRGRDAVIAFMAVDCGLCDDLRGDLSRFADDRPYVEVIAVVAGERRTASDFAQPLSRRIVVVPDRGGRLSTRIGVAALPFLMAVDGDRIVRRKGIVNERADIERIVDGDRLAKTVVEPALRGVN